MIKEIQDNPFRILGVFSNSATKDIVANEGKMKAFLKVGRAVSYPLDLPSILPSVERNETIVSTAKSQIALPDDKVKHAQFWFIRSSQIDDIAFNHLYQGDFDGALETFQKKRSASSLQNLVVCDLIKGYYQAAVQTAASLYSEFLDDFVKTIDPQATSNKQTLINQFVNGLIDSGVDLSSLRTSLTDPDWTGAINGIVSKPLVDNLKKALESAKASRGNGSNARFIAGNKLMSVVKSSLPNLKGVLDSLQYQVLADELANEILQCGIDYFNDSRDDDAPHKAMPIQKYALTIAVGSVTKDRCKENVDILQKIIEKLPPKEVAVEAKAINKELEKFCKLPDKISHSISLLNAVKPYIIAIKNKLGSSNSFYLKISTQVVGNALHNVIEEVNVAQKMIQSYEEYKAEKERQRQWQRNSMYDDDDPFGDNSLLSSRFHPSLYSSPLLEQIEYNTWVGIHNAQVNSFKEVARSAWNAIKLMDKFDMESAFKYKRYDENRKVLKGMCDKLGIPTSTWSVGGGSGCMVVFAIVFALGFLVSCL